MKKHALIVVFGDIGRSPRMLNHASGFLGSDFSVDIIGYLDAPIPEELSECTIYKLCGLKKTIASLLMMAVNMILLTFSFIRLLLVIKRPSVIIVQNPPTLPAMLTIPIYARLVGAKYILDWHNLGFTIFQTKYPQLPRMGQLLKHSELWLGAFAHEHLAVSKALKNWLNATLKAPITLCPDVAPAKFHRRDTISIHTFMSELCLGDDSLTGKITIEKNGKLGMFQERPAIVVTSTSWTPDEDFDMLFEAIAACDEMVARLSPRRFAQFPTVWFFITGKGPLRPVYEAKIKELKLSVFRPKTIWLKAEDYPKLLGCADLGICMHRSSSGLDLPMKVVDMLASRLPVLAYRYECIDELVSLKNTFVSKDELAQLMFDLLSNMNNNAKLKLMVKELEQLPHHSAKSAWQQSILPLLSSTAD